MRSKAPDSSRRTRPTRPEKVVWTVLVHEGFIAILEPRAQSIARQQFVVSFANTWPQARVILTATEYRELRRLKADEDEVAKASSHESFDPPGAFDDGDWPGWPAQEALKWIPRAIVQKYGEVEDSVHNGMFLQWKAAAPKIVAALESAGFALQRDDDLCHLAVGYGSAAKEIVRKIDAFDATDFTVSLTKGPTVLRTGHRTDEIEQYLKRRGHSFGVVVTGYNPSSTQQSDAQNVAANKVLRKALVAAGATLRSASGSARDGSWPAEPGWFASGLPLVTAMQIAKSAGQDAVLFCPAGGTPAIWWARLPIGGSGDVPPFSVPAAMRVR
jgi:hypothetical protein